MGKKTLLLVVVHTDIYCFFQTRLWPFNVYAVLFASSTCFGK